VGPEIDEKRKRAEGKEILGAWQSTADRAAAGSLDQARIREIVLETVQRVTGKRPDSPTVSELLERWIRTERGAVSPGTIMRYEQIVRDFLSSIGTQADALSTDTILEFKERWLSGGPSPRTVNQTLGLDPERWAMMNPAVEMHLIDILDDAVFEIVLLRDYKARTGGVDERRVGELMRTVDKYCVEIFGTTIPLVQLEKAWRMRANTGRNGASKFSSDASVPEWIRKQHERFNSQGYETVASHSLVPQVRDLVEANVAVPSDTAERIALEYREYTRDYP
jgi:hypothetical protein